MVEVQGASAHATPLFPPHLIHQHRQVACVARREKKNDESANLETERVIVKWGSDLVEGRCRTSGDLLAEGASSWRS